MIQPIETTYRGVRFRSRLEARWAVFFDSMGMTWEYEPEKFRLPDGRWYIPDFRLDGKVWAEVKAPGGDFEKAWLFEDRIVLLEGPPGRSRNGHYRVLRSPPCTEEEYPCICTASRCPECQAATPEHTDCTRHYSSCNESVFVGRGREDAHFYWTWGGDEIDPWDYCFPCWGQPQVSWGQILDSAVSKALSERFGAHP